MNKSERGSWHRLMRNLAITKLKSLLNVAIACLAFSTSAAYAVPAFNKTFSPNTIAPGGASTLTFTITNDATPASGVNFVDNLPAGVVIANPANLSNSCQGSVNASSGATSITLSDGRLPGNQSCMITVNVTSAVAGSFTNVTDDLTSSDGNSGTATATLTVTADRPNFSKAFSPNSVGLGDRSTLTFTIDNSANNALARSLRFTDNLPIGMEVADPANVINTCNGGIVSANPGSNVISYDPANQLDATVDANSSCLISVEIVSTAVGTLLNTSGELTSVNGTFQLVSSGFAAAELDVNVATVNLIKTFLNDPVTAGSTVELNFSVTNRDRRSNASDITFSDDVGSILPGLVAIGLPQTGVCGAGSTLSGTDVISLSGANLSGGASCNFSVTLQVPANAAAGGYTNLTSALTANLNGSPFTGNMASDTLFVGAGPSLSKTFLSNAVGGGDTVVMQFTATNNNTTSAATNITFTDNISDFVSGATVSALPAAGSCGAGSSVITFIDTTELILQLIGGNLAAGESCTFSVDVLIPEAASDGVSTNVTSAISATIDGSTQMGPEAQASLTIVSTPSLIKLFTDDPVAPGDSVTLEFTVSSPAEALGTITNITFSDDLNAALPGLVATGLPINDVCGAGSSLSGTSSITLSGGSLDVGDSCTFSVTLDVPANALPGNYQNQTSEISATTSGANTSGPGANDILTVAGLDVSKSFIQNPVIPGDTVTMRLLINNTSASLDATNIMITDNLNSFISGTTEVGNLPLNDVCGAGSNLSVIGSSLIALQGANLVAGESCTIDIDLLIPAATAEATYSNVTSNITATIGGGTIVLDPASAGLSVSSQLIGLSKTFAQSSVSLGTSTSLEFIVSNLSATESITDIAFTDDLDAGLSGLLATGLPLNGICGVGSSLSGTSVISLNGGSLAPGASCTFNVDLSVPASANGQAIINNTTSAVSGLVGNLAVNGVAASDDAIIVDVDYSKVFDNPTVAGDVATLSFSIQNNGDTTLDRLFFTDDLEAVVSGLVAIGLPASDVCGPGSIVTGTSIITLTGGVLASGESCQFDVTVSIPDAASGDFENITSVLRNDPLDVAAPAIAPLEVLVRSATFEKSFDSAVNPGQSATLSFDIQNTGTADLNDLAFSDDLEAVLSGLSASGLPISDVCGTGSTLSGTSEIVLSGGNLQANTSCQFSVQVAVPSDSAAADYTNTTSDLSEAGSTLAEAATADLTVNALPAAEFSKSFGANVNPGSSTSLDFEIRNTGNVALTQLAFSDDLEAVLTGLAASGLPLSDACGAGSTLSGNSTISLTDGNLAVGAACQFSVQVDVPAGSAAGGYSNTTSALTESGSNIADPASALLTVNQVNNDKVKICLKPGTYYQRELLVKRRLADILIYFGLAIEGSCPEPEPKVTLCHKYYKWYYYWGKPYYKTIRVHPRKVRRHLWHGDRLGACRW